VKILDGREVTHFKKAAELTFREAGADDMHLSAASLFDSVIDTSQLSPQDEKNIAATIRSRYRGNPTWYAESWWYVPVPALGYDAVGAPRVVIEVTTYLVATVEVDAGKHSSPVTLTGPVKKSETLVIPVTFLQAVLDDDLCRFNVLARSDGKTTWEIPGFKPVQLPDDFVARLSDVLRRKSVAGWLEDFGFQGMRVRPLVVGSLLGLQFMGTAGAVSSGKQGCTHEQLVVALQTMAYSATEAKEMISRAAPRLRADQTLEESVRIVLQNAAEGG